jgi:hypothetical protein
MSLKRILLISSRASTTINPSEFVHSSPLLFLPSGLLTAALLLSPLNRMSSNRSILLFGHGDGGGGPAVSHLEKLRRLSPCQSMSRIHMSSTPDAFFAEIQQDFDQSTKNARSVPHPIWRGELYLELHQGTFTSQAKIKYQNRFCETLLRGLDALYAMAVIGSQRDLLQLTEAGNEYLSSLGAIIRALWKDTLLNQFHDVIREFLVSLLTLTLTLTFSSFSSLYSYLSRLKHRYGLCGLIKNA